MEGDIQMYLSELANYHWRDYESTENKESQREYHEIYDTKNKLDKYCRAQEKEIIDLNLELIKLKLQIIKMSLWNI